jgi:hypothetical protein
MGFPALTLKQYHSADLSRGRSGSDTLEGEVSYWAAELVAYPVGRYLVR